VNSEHEKCDIDVLGSSVLEQIVGPTGDKLDDLEGAGGVIVNVAGGDWEAHNCIA